MSLAITDDHQALAEVARSIVKNRAGTAAARAILLDPDSDGRWWEADALWKEMIATGWLGLHVAEAFGGQGFGLSELTIVLEELGRAAIGGPFLPTVAASAVIAEMGTAEQRERWLPQLVSGDLVAGIAVAGTVDVADERAAGAQIATVGERAADIVLLPVGDDLVVVEAGDGVRTRRTQSVDQLMRPITVVDLSSAPVVEVLAGAAVAATRILRLLACAEAVGGMSACTAMATAYAATREQFGRPIGSYQAVKHHCANMLVDTELAVAVTWDAARATGSEADIAVTMAAAQVLPAYQRVALANIQVHGGIGYTWEHDAGLFVRRATVLLTVAGGPDLLRDRVFDLQSAGRRRSVSLLLPPEADGYRRAVREFGDELAGTGPAERPALWARSGYLQPHWPIPYGRAADSVEQLIIEEELDGTDRPDLGIGEWLLLTLLQHGTPEQIDRLLWPSLEGELRWCQLFSEPGAGSDAAAVATKATRVDGGWRISGQKVWSSDAVNCQRGVATVRTDPGAPKHKGITAVIIDLSDPAVEIRPLTELTGEALFNEVFFDDVFVADHDVLGPVNAGWSVAMAAFGNERVSIGGGSVTMTADVLLDLVARHGGRERGLGRDTGHLLTEAYALACLNLRQAARAVIDAGPGIEGNIAKLVRAEHAQRVAELAMRIAGPVVMVGAEPEVVHDYLFSRCLTIAGGTSEIVRNLIAERILKLPREPMGVAK